MARYTVILEKGDTSWSAYVPDLPGCVAAATTEAATKSLIREAITLHLDLMRQDGEPIPTPTTRATLVTI